tara:strand:+ start:1939 stop:2751 length:813 start_codon:yes stop_codon:yes gene_type:complete
MKNKIVDCITFFDNNFMFDFRYNVLRNYVDYFVICESIYDHRGNIKKKNFIKKKEYDQKKIRYVVLEKPFPKNTNIWENQAIQREFLLDNLNFIDSEDYVFFSDPDEIPNPSLLTNFELKNKYGIFMQQCFNFKFNLFNKHESPWEGTRVCKKKNLKSIDFMRQKVVSKNLNYNFFRIDKEKNIQIFNNGGWHFNNILSPDQISLKLRTFAHSEFASGKFSSSEIIKKNIERKKDLFGRGHTYQKVEIDETFPEYLINNKDKYLNWILKD